MSHFATLLLPVIMALVWAYFWYIALRVLWGKRPLIFSTRWFFGLLAVAFLPGILNPFLVHVEGKFAVLAWLNPVIFLLLLGFLWLQMKGWYAFGITEGPFRAAILAAIAGQGWTAEESLACVRIRETGDEVKVAVHGLTGTAQLRVAGSAATERVIVEGMRVFYAEHPGEMNTVTCYFYLITGGFIGLCGVVIPFIFLG